MATVSFHIVLYRNDCYAWEMHDGHGRAIDYLRISITDRCNERCRYCMPEQFSDWLPRSEILSYEEILRIARVAVSLGVRTIRITGGEPLVRRDVLPFLRELGGVPGLRKLCMTTNATLLAPLAADLHAAGVGSVNVSLDTLEERAYHDLTRGRLADALAGIDAALAAGMNVKLNAVLVRGTSEQAMPELVRFAAERSISALRFIELMPISDRDMLGSEHFLSAADAMAMLGRLGDLQPLPDAQLGQGPARYYRLQPHGLTIGFISAMSDEHFCETCNKMRITADGFLRPCLGNHGELDLKPALRPHASDAAIREVFRAALHEKPLKHIFRDEYTPLRIMTAIGG